MIGRENKGRRMRAVGDGGPDVLGSLEMSSGPRVHRWKQCSGAAAAKLMAEESMLRVWHDFRSESWAKSDWKYIQERVIRDC